jgi:hypothetical protein
MGNRGLVRLDWEIFESMPICQAKRAWGDDGKVESLGRDHKAVSRVLFSGFTGKGLGCVVSMPDCPLGIWIR